MPSHQSHGHVRILVFMGVFITLLCISGFNASAQGTPQTYIVTSLDDSTNTGTLRWALNQSNTNTGDDTITFQAGLTGTIHLTSDLPTITDVLTVIGSGESVITIDGGGNDGFLIMPSFNVIVPRQANISGLTLTNLRYALHVFNGNQPGNISLTDVTITHSGDDSIVFGLPALLVGDSDLTINRLTMTDNVGWFGGALAYGVDNAENRLSITDSTFLRNGSAQESYGAAIIINDSIDTAGQTSNHTITNSTFADNYTSGTGGAISAFTGPNPNQPFAGGQTSLVITNSTFSNNTAPNTSAIDIKGNVNLELYFSTFSGHDVDTISQTGVLHAGDGTTIQMVGSIIANNAAVGMPLECTISGTGIFTGSYNLSSDNNCPSRVGVPTGIDTVLADNGGITLTHALLAGSNAIDAYTPIDCPLTDQRGLARPLGNSCDLGAYESDDFTIYPRVDLSKNVINIVEDGTADSYTAVLHTQPMNEVVISISGDNQTQVSPNLLTFTTSNWNLPQTVMVTAVNDADIEGPHSSQIIHSVSSADSDYNGIYINSITAHIVDNDVPAINVIETDGATSINEGGISDSYALTLDTQPSADVLITLAGDADLEVNPTSISFTSANWDIPQIVTVAVMDNLIAEGIRFGAIQHTVSSVDANYHGMNVQNIVVSIFDNDTAGITFNKTAISLTENGNGDSYSIALTSQPISPVAITISANTDIITSITTLTFTSTNWEIPQQVAVTVIDDLIAKGVHSEVIQHSVSSADTHYNGLSVQSLTVVITDNDTAGVIFSKSSLNIAEGGITDSYTVVLNSQPRGNVYLSVYNHNAPDIRLSPPSLTFNNANWNIPQTVTITAYNERILEGDHTQPITYNISEFSGDYHEVEVNEIVANIIDDETAIYYIMDSNTNNGIVQIDELLGATGIAYPKIALLVYGTGDGIFGIDHAVQIGYSVVSGTATNNGVDYTLNDGLITLPATNSGMSITGFSIPIIDDMIDEDTEYFTIELEENEFGTSGNYDTAISPSPYMQRIEYQILDNDLAGVNITKDFFRIREGITETVLISLNSQPTANVVINTNHDNSQFTITPQTLVFTPESWNIQQTLTITAVDDAIAEQTFFKRMEINGISNDEKYSGFLYKPFQPFPITLAIYVTDNDTTGITQSKTAVSLIEGSTSDSYTIVLTSQPTADVTVNVTDDAQCSADVESLTFTAENWNMAQTVTITGVDDAIFEAEHSCSIAHVVTSVDTHYNGFSLANITGTITDNDATGITQSKTTVSLTEGGATESYTVVLTSQPTADVTISVTDEPQCSSDVESMTFTPANWNTAQTVTIAAVDDTTFEAQHSCAITHTVTSTDTNYNGFALANVTGTITDNDATGITQSKTAVSLTEGSTSDSYTIVLTSQPTSDVMVNVTDDAQCSADIESVTFTPANWNTAQTVTIVAVDDATFEAEHSCSIAHVVTSTDTNYNGFALANVTGTITDNDATGITQSKTAVSLTEGSTSDSYTIVLTSQPTSDVMVNVTDDAQCSADVESLNFTAENWNTAQAVTVAAVDDTTFEAQHSCAITHTVTSADTHYNGFVLANVTGTITDDESEAMTTELLDNGGFELAGTSNALPANWTVQNAKGDKRMCPLKTANLHNGACAFKFTGNGNGITKLTQNVDLVGHTFNQNDTLTVTAYFKGINATAKVKITLSVYYTGATARLKRSFTIPRKASYVQYILPTYTLGIDGLNSKDITKIEVEFAHPSNGTTLWVDDVSLIHTVPAIISRETPLPLPDVPDGFRGNQ